jgi:uncharacterized membrane protein YgcG
MSRIDAVNLDEIEEHFENAPVPEPPTNIMFTELARTQENATEQYLVVLRTWTIIALAAIALVIVVWTCVYIFTWYYSRIRRITPQLSLNSHGMLVVTPLVPLSKKLE